MARQAKLSTFLKGDASTSQPPGTFQEWSIENPGPYIGTVKGNKDPAKMGRLNVLIPALTASREVKENQLIVCEYLSPFYGAKESVHNIPNSRLYEGTQHSYGFWAVPPDIGAKVLVIFAEGKIENAYWIGCIQDPFTNHMIPGIASSENTYGKETGGPPGTEAFGVDKKATYGTLKVPAGELNRASIGALSLGNYDSIAKPIHPFADILLAQGLSADDVRGNTSSSARRESPSQVMGISTPGQPNKTKSPKPVGTKDSGAIEYVDRRPGHTFAMDDGDENGDNQLIRLRTSSGHQLLMHDTEGVVYIANGTGNSWIEMNREGRIDVYSGVGGINLRTSGDFNFHSDANINFHAGNSIRMSATGEIISSANMLLNLGEQGVLTSSMNGGVRTYGQQGISSYSGGSQLHGASQSVHLAGSQVHFNTVGASAAWGPNWMDPTSVGIAEREEGDVDITKKGIAPLEPFTKQTKTTVHRLVTHEPMQRYNSFMSTGVQPIDHDDKKTWSKLSSSPGTTEFVEQRNRTSDIESIRVGQYQSDLTEHMKTKMKTSIDSSKARNIAEKFAKGYDKTYNLRSSVNSISNKFLTSSIGKTTEKIKNNLQSTLTDQVIDSVTGGHISLFKDNVFVNEAGKLFSLGNVNQKIDGLVSGTTGNLSIGKNVTTTIGNVLSGNPHLDIGGIVKATSVGSVLTNAKSVTNVYKNVMAGNITGITQITSIKQALSGFAGTTMTKIASIGRSVGSFASKAFSRFF